MCLKKIMFLSFTMLNTLCATSAISYRAKTGQLSDNLLAFSYAKWVAYLHNLPLLYWPFPLGEQLVLSQHHEPYDIKAYTKITKFNQLKNLLIEKDSDTLYIIPYFPEDYSFLTMNIDWDDPIFRQQLKDTIKPLVPIPPLDLPKNCITVALNVEAGIDTALFQESFYHTPIERKPFPSNAECIEHIKTIAALFHDQPLKVYLLGAAPAKMAYYKRAVNKPNVSFSCPMGKVVLSKNHITLGLPTHHDKAFDGETKIVYSDLAFPLRFPPDSFFIEAIITLSNLLQNAPMYVHLFTDDPQPNELINRYKERIQKPNILFGCRKGNNQLEDLLAMTQFDCLIRGESSIAFIASKISDYMIEISPKHYRWEDKHLIITESIISKKERSCTVTS